MENDNKKFEYTYVAPTAEERKQIMDIREQYVPKTVNESKFYRLKKLDSKVRKIPMAVSLVLGIIGTLVFGTGLTMILQWDILIWGSVVSAAGLLPVAAAYPVYKMLYDRYKKLHGEEILKLSDELLRGIDE